MPFITTIVDLQPGRSGVAVPGYPAQVIAAQNHLAALAAVYPADGALFVMPGRSDLANLVPLQERDIGADRIFVAATTGTTRVTDGTVLGGLPRFLFGGTDIGLTANLDAALTDYTAVILARASNVSGAKFLLTVGSNGATRTGIYINGDDLAVQHGTANVVSTTGTVVVANAWVPVIVSYRNSDRAIQIFGGTTTPLFTGTIAASPPAEVVTAIGSLLTTSNPHVGEIALCAIWRRVMHTDAAAMAALVNALNGLIALPNAA